MKKRQYSAPQLTMVCFKAECGYAASGLLQRLSMDNATQDHNSQCQENWQDGGNLFGSW